MTKKRSSHQAQNVPEISAEVQKELATLQAGEGRYRLLFETSPNALFLIGKDGHFLDANQAALDWYGYSLQEFRNMAVADLAASRELSLKAVGRVQHAVQGPTRFEWRHRRKDGRELPVEINTTPVKIGGEACTFAIVSDISERKLAEETLHDQTANLTRSQKIGKLGSWDWDIAENILIWSDELYRIWGIEKNFLLSFDSIAGMIHPEDRALNSKQVQEILANKDEGSFEFRILCPDGSIKYLHQSIEITCDESGQPIRAFGVMQDITERKQAEEALKANEERYRTLVENMNDIVMEVDSRGNFCYISPNYPTLSGYSVAEELGNSAFAHVHPEDIPLLLQKLGNALDAKQSMVYRVQHKNGEWLWIETSGKPYRAGDGSLHVISVARNISERKLAEEILKASEEKFQAIANYTVNWESWFGPDGKYLWINPGVEQITGYSAEEILAMPDFISIVIAEEDRPDFIEHFQSAIHGSRGENFEFRYLHKNGAKRWLEVSWQPIYDVQGKPLGTRASGREISERKRMETERQALLEIMQGVAATGNLHEFLALVHGSLKNVLCAENFSVVFHNDGTGLFEEVYAVDQFDAPMPPSKLAKSITSYVFRTAEPLLLDQAKYEVLEAQGEVELIGTNSPSWLGAPLKTPNKTIGVIAVQNYEVADCYTERDLDFLASVCTQVSLAIERKQAEQALRESNELLSSFIKHSPVYAFIKEVTPGESRVLRASENYQEMIGVPGSEMAGKSMQELFPAEAAEKFTADDWAVVSGGKVLKLDEELNGRSYTTIKFPILHGDKKLLAGYTIDITERKQAEDAIRHTEKRASALIENAPDGIVFVSADGKFTYASPSAYRLFGYEAAELNRLSPNELTHPEDLPMVLAALGELMQNSTQVTTLQYRFLHKDGRWLWIESTFSNLLTEPSIAAIVINFRDINERKQAEEALSASEERFSTIFRVNPAACALTRIRDNQLIDVSQAWQDLTGFTHAEAVGHTVFELNLWVESENREKLIETLRQQGRARGEAKIRQKSGGLCDVLMSAELIELAGEKYLLTMAQDITERKQIEEQIQQLNTELEQRVEKRTRDLQEAQEKLVRQEKLAVLGQLAGGVGHELRNPLSVINNAVYLLKLVQADASPQVKEYLGIINQETHTAEKIISDLLEFSRTKSVERGPVAVKEMFQQVLERFPAPGNVTVKFKLPVDLPPVFADPRHMVQVFGNLTVNACQAMPDGGTLSLSAKKKGHEIAISVTDTGTGITPENMKKLFEPLFTTKAKGIGLGLAVSRKLVEANEGRLEIRSEVGKGSTFIVYLPTQPEKT